MKKTLTALLSLLTISLATAQTTATPTTPAPIKLATTATVSNASLSLSAASRIATLAVSNCAQRGYNVSATVVDRSGVTLAVARAENAGPHTLGASLGKAFTSASARNLTSNIAKGLADNPGLADIPGYLVLAGGAPIRVGDVVVGAVGVGGAPSGLIDEKCGTDATATVLSQ
ncbi:GlcG/HbpS family heme-binding protein [Deinococcus alpinitundrae]|uniref:GlcG/HbpS family heme-binding protein n=1 Tax=Deinococcus alpinitundrae TaxID=468913 RepID=UPI0013795EAD|nr:heme-binding protein [Deinococcus alpinitundrae]